MRKRRPKAGGVCPALPLAAVLALLWQLWAARGQPLRDRLRGLWRQKWLLLFFVYLSTMLVSTLFSRPTTDPLRSVLDHFWFTRDERWNNEIIENILFFIPFSLLFLLVFQPARPLRAALGASLAATLFIEGCQLVFHRGEFQFSDLLYNTLGGLLGYGLWQLIRQRFQADQSEKS